MSLLSRLASLLAGRGGERRKADPEQAQELLAAGAVLVDVRSRDEFAAGHAPRARSIPLDQLASRAGEIAAGRPVVTICRSGGRSARAAAVLRATGREVTDVRGGMLAWQRAGLPVEGRRGPGRVV